MSASSILLTSFFIYLLVGSIDFILKECTWQSLQRRGKLWQEMPKILVSRAWPLIIIGLYVALHIIIAFKFNEPVILVGLISFYLEDAIYFVLSYITFKEKLPTFLPWLHMGIPWYRKIVGDFPRQLFVKVLAAQIFITFLIIYILR